MFLITKKTVSEPEILYYLGFLAAAGLKCEHYQQRCVQSLCLRRNKIISHKCEIASENYVQQYFIVYCTNNKLYPLPCVSCLTQHEENSTM